MVCMHTVCSVQIYLGSFPGLTSSKELFMTVIGLTEL